MWHRRMSEPLPTALNVRSHLFFLFVNFKVATHCEIDSSIQGNTNPVHRDDLAQERLLRDDGNRWEPEKINRRENTIDDQIEVESPSPGRRGISKSAADNGTQNCTGSPCQASHAHVVRSFLHRGESRDQIEHSIPVLVQVKSSQIRHKTNPRYCPAPPAPAMTRPTIKASIFGAPPQIALPVAKITRLMI